MRTDFAAIILTHGRPHKVVTYNTLKKCGYTGKIYLLLDDKDSTIPEYEKKFGKQNLIIFSKDEIEKTFDKGDNFAHQKSTSYARNAMFAEAKRLGLKWFIQLDDDYNAFSFMYDDLGNFKQQPLKKLDRIFSCYIEFLNDTGFDTVAFLQRGDLIGGGESTALTGNHYPFKKRKAMNSFFFSVDSDIRFLGKLNEDVNTYVVHGGRGRLLASVPLISLNQATTQATSGGMTDIYLNQGTYVKSFYTVMYQPSSVKVAMMGETHRRIHHQINWNTTVPKILDESLKKPKLPFPITNDGNI